MFNPNDSPSPIGQLPENKPSAQGFSLNNNSSEPTPKDEVYVMPEKFHSEHGKSSSGKPLIIALIILVLIAAATATYFLYDMWQKNQNGRAMINQNVNLGNEINQAINQNENSNSNLNGDLNNGLNLNADVNANISTSTPPENTGSYTANTPPSVSSDSDSDGLTDVEEGMIGSSPIEQDSDKDGYIDGQEFMSGYSPVLAVGGNAGKLAAANFIVSLTTNFIKDNFKVLYIRGWQATTVPATNQVIITTNTGEVIKISVRDNSGQMSAATWYLSSNPQASLSDLKSITAGDLSGVFSPNGLQAYLTDAQKNKIYSFEYLMDANAQFRYSAIFTMVIKNLQLVSGGGSVEQTQSQNLEIIFSDNLSSCTKYKMAFRHPLTGATLEKEILGIVNGKCGYTEQMPNNGKMECNYTESERKVMAQYYKELASTGSFSTSVNIDLTSGQVKTKYTINGKEVENPLQEAISSKICVISGY